MTDYGQFMLAMSTDSRQTEQDWPCQTWMTNKALMSSRE